MAFKVFKKRFYLRAPEESDSSGNLHLEDQIRTTNTKFYTKGFKFKFCSQKRLDRVNCARLRRPYGKMGGLGGSVWVMGKWSLSVQ